MSDLFEDGGASGAVDTTGTTGTTGTPGRFLAGLNDAQRRAVEHDGGPVIVLAGPGTGKTRVITRRIAHMIADRGIEPESVLALTFTNKAAGEMRDRLGELLDPVAAARVNAHTFNGFGAMLLRRFSDLVGLPPDPELIDSAQRMRMMRMIVEDRRLFRDAVASGVDGAIRTAQKLIGSMTSAGLTPASARERVRARLATIDGGGMDPDEATAERARAARLAEIIDLWEAFDAACLERGLISFDHQVAWSNRVLRDSDKARAMVRQDYRHIVVDEFQDVNDAQIELLRLLAPPDARNGLGPDLCIVGDDDQAIYAFRGADDRAFQKFEHAWPDATTVMLEENYRSATPVLDAAAAIIGGAHERFRPDKIVRRASGKGDEPAGAVVEGVQLEHHLQAGEAIASMIRADLQARDGAMPGDHAVIARNWTEIDRIRAILEIEGLPCRASRAAAPADDPGVLDVLAWVDLLLEPTHTWSARRLLVRPPFSLPIDLVKDAEQAYRARRSRVEHANRRARENAADPESVTDTPFPHFVDWLETALADGVVPCDDTARTVLTRFIALWRDLAARAATAPAHEVLAHIVRRTDVVHAELLDGPARSARVNAVVGLLRFAVERAARLEEPGDLRAFIAYTEDLDDGEQTFRAGGLTHEADEEGDDEGGRDAVHLLTAHGAKGLEFDSVYLPRVETQHGFPSVRKPDEDNILPSWLSGDDRDDHEIARQDEERRLFYVACTRAQRRLVVLGKLPKKRSSSTNYFFELLDEPELIVPREAHEVLGPHPRDGIEHAAPLPAWDRAERRRERLREARRVAQLDAAGALGEAMLVLPDRDGMGSIEERLGAAARRMAIIGAAQRGEDLPGWAAGAPALASLHAALLDPDSEDAAAPASAVLASMKAPLTLSYTHLKDWESCPRCFAVKYVLNLPQPETSKQVVGTVVHAALEQFYTRVKLAGEQGTPAPTLDDLLEIGDRVFRTRWGTGDAYDREQRERVVALLRMTHDNLHDDRLNPQHTELACSFPYTHEGVTHTIKAKIDRVDESPSGFRVVDYKTGRASKALTEPGKKDTQFGIYALALRSYINSGPWEGLEPPAGGAEYWVLATGERGRVSFDELASYESKLRAKIDKAIEGMLAGDYPRKANGCDGTCTFLDPGIDPA